MYKQYEPELIIVLHFMLQDNLTERGGSVVMHETRIQEVLGSNSGADQPDWGFFVVFLSHQGPFDHYSSNSYIIKLKSVNLPNETLITQQ